MADHRFERKPRAVEHTSRGYTRGMDWELWETDSGNLLYHFGAEAAVLAAVRELISLNGPDTMDAVTLLRADAGGAVSAVATGSELVARAYRDAVSTNLDPPARRSS